MMPTVSMTAQTSTSRAWKRCMDRIRFEILVVGAGGASVVDDALDRRSALPLRDPASLPNSNTIRVLERDGEQPERHPPTS